jgi:hypothetical protein
VYLLHKIRQSHSSLPIYSVLHLFATAFAVFKDRESFKVLNKWCSIREFLENEISRLSALFDEKGIEINKDASTVPPSSEEK